MGKITVLIVEDKLLVAEDIASRLRKHNFEITGIYDSGEDAIKAIDIQIPDLILMDIQLAGELDGIATAQIVKKKISIPIIYLSDHIDIKTVERAKKTLPANYLSKPFNEPDLIRAIDLAFYTAQTTKQISKNSLLSGHVFLRIENQSFIKLAYDEIIYLEADRAYCDVITEKKTHKLTISMNHVHEQLDNKDFIRVHRSHIVNINKITAIEGRILKLGVHEIQMNEEMHGEILQRLKLIK